MMREKWLGLVGTSFVHPREPEEWVFIKQSNLILLFLLNRDGGSKQCEIHYYIVSLRQGIFHTQSFCKLQLIIIPLMHSGVFWQPNPWFNKELIGMWAMGLLFGYGAINGCQLLPHTRWYLLGNFYMLTHGSVN